MGSVTGTVIDVPWQEISSLGTASSLISSASGFFCPRIHAKGRQTFVFLSQSSDRTTIGRLSFFKQEKSKHAFKPIPNLPLRGMCDSLVAVFDVIKATFFFYIESFLLRGFINSFDELKHLNIIVADFMPIPVSLQIRAHRFGSLNL